jgi:hypothetical protein
VVGAVCVYLLLAVLWAYLYNAIEVAAPGTILVRAQPFSGSGALPMADAQGIKMLYISMATITTLGNSDIPVTFLARQIATIEAITASFISPFSSSGWSDSAPPPAPPQTGSD